MRTSILAALLFLVGVGSYASSIQGKYVSSDDAAYIVTVVDPSTLLLKEDMGLGLPPDCFRKQNGIWVLQPSDKDRALGYIAKRTIEFSGDDRFVMRQDMDGTTVQVVYYRRH